MLNYIGILNLIVYSNFPNNPTIVRVHEHWRNNYPQRFTELKDKAMLLIVNF